MLFQGPSCEVSPTGAGRCAARLAAGDPTKSRPEPPAPRALHVRLCKWRRTGRTTIAHSPRTFSPYTLLPRSKTFESPPYYHFPPHYQGIFLSSRTDPLLQSPQRCLRHWPKVSTDNSTYACRCGVPSIPNVISLVAYSSTVYCTFLCQPACRHRPALRISARQHSNPAAPS